MTNALLFIIIILLICACLFLSQILWQNEQYHLENKKRLSADIIDARNERMTSMVHSQFWLEKPQIQTQIQLFMRGLLMSI